MKEGKEETEILLLPFVFINFKNSHLTKYNRVIFCFWGECTALGNENTLI